MFYVFSSVVVACVGFYLCLKTENVELGSFMMFVSISVLCFIFMIVGTTRIKAVKLIGEIDEMIDLVKDVPAEEIDGDLLDYVLNLNLEISNCRTMNSIPTLDLFYSDELCNKQMISVPDKQEVIND